MSAHNGNGNGGEQDVEDVHQRKTPVDTTVREETEAAPRHLRFIARPTEVSLADLDAKIDAGIEDIRDIRKALDSFRAGRMQADQALFAAMRQLRDDVKREIGVVSRMFDSATEQVERNRVELAEFKVAILRVLSGVGADKAVERAEEERDALRAELDEQRAIAKRATAQVGALEAETHGEQARARAVAIQAAQARVLEARARIVFYARLAAVAIVALVILGKVLL